MLIRNHLLSVEVLFIVIMLSHKHVRIMSAFNPLTDIGGFN